MLKFCSDLCKHPRRDLSFLSQTNKLISTKLTGYTEGSEISENFPVSGPIHSHHYSFPVYCFIVNRDVNFHIKFISSKEFPICNFYCSNLTKKTPHRVHISRWSVKSTKGRKSGTN